MPHGSSYQKSLADGDIPHKSRIILFGFLEEGIKKTPQI